MNTKIACFNDVLKKFPDCRQLHDAWNSKITNTQFLHGFINSLLWTNNLESNEYLKLNHDLIKINLEFHTGQKYD